MSSLTVFYQNCPTCGRSLRVAVKYFGKPMSCSHCGGEFRAGDFLGSDGEESADSECAEHAGSRIVLHAHFGAPELGEV